jgi:hypothetical protein
LDLLGKDFKWDSICVFKWLKNILKN